MGVTIEQYRERIGCHNIKNTSTSIQDNESLFLSGRFFNKRLMLFHLYVFLVIMFTIWPAAGQIVTSIIILSHTVVDIQFPPLQVCFIDHPDGPSLVIYCNALPFTTNSTFPTIVNKNIYNKKFPNQLYIQRKSHNISYFYNIIHFRLSSGRHMHAWRA